MPKAIKQKQKLLYLAKLFYEKTDDAHGLSTSEIISNLKQNGVGADRKTIYNDIEELRQFGLDILKYQEGRHVFYKLSSRNFELPELKLLVDSVQSSQFITEQKSRELIQKLESLVSVHEAKQLHRQVMLTGRVKTMNESIYYSVDQIHEAINNDCQITFQYFQWNTKKQHELRHNGALYCISPWALVWNSENYYLIGYDSTADKIKHYRVDKMLHLEMTDCRREGMKLFQEMTLPKYSKGLFGMYGGHAVDVTLLCENAMVGPIIDRFGKDIMLFPVDPEHFQVHVQVYASEQFLGWVIALGKGVKIIAPQTMVDAMKCEIQRLTEQYMG